ncbi:MAG: hypothetical protein JEY94_13790 [Melioribacteraceae bacterium]|nr:hypothetical protein [Melioribacteraceae bacterium]
MKQAVLLFLFVLLLNTYSQELLVKDYYERSGLPSLATYDIEQTADKFIWISTPTGIYKYDGFLWNNQTNSLNLKSTSFFRIGLDNKGCLWGLPIITNSELVFFDGKKWNKFDSPNLKLYANEFSVINDENGIEILISTVDSKLLHFKSGTWEQIDLPRLNSIITSNIIQTDKEFMLSLNDGIYKLVNSKLVAQTELNAILPHDPIIHLKQIYNKKGELELWTLSGTRIGKISNNKFDLISNDIMIPENQPLITSFIEPDNLGNVYFGNANGLYSYQLNSDTLRKISFSEEDQSKGGTSLIVDHEKNIWIINLREIKKFRVSPFTNYNSEIGLPSNEVASICVLKDGSKILGQNGSLSFIDESGIETVYFKNAGNKVDISTRMMDYAYDSNNDAWICVTGVGIAKVNGQTPDWKFLHKGEHIQTIAIDTSDNVFVGTEKGVRILRDNNLIPITPDIKNMVRKIKILPDNSLAVCTAGNGLYIWKNNSYVQYKSKNLLGNSLYNFSYSKKYGSLIAAKDGIYQIQDSLLTRFPLDYVGNREPVYSINIEKDSILWIGTHKGVVKYNGNSLRYYNQYNGLAGDEINRNGFAIDDDGSIWIGTHKGASKYSAKYDINDDYAPTIFISSIESSNGTFADNFDSLEFNKNDVIIFNYRCLSYIDERNNKFIVNLLNSDGSLVNSDTTYNNSVKFVALAAGNYRLEIESLNPLHVKSKTIASVNFSIEQPYYLTWWFILASIILFITFVYLTQEYFNQKKYTIKLQKEVARQTKEIKESENRLHILSETTFEGIAILKADEIIHVTRQLAAMLNYNTDELIGSNISKVLAVDAIKFINNGSLDGAKSEHIACRKDNKEFEVELRRRNIVFNGLDAKAVVFRDISEIKSIQKSLIEAKNRAERSEELKTEFLAQMSHEIRSPMNTVLNFANLLKEEINKKEYDDYFESMSIAGKRIVRTINLILDMSQIQTGTYEPIYKKFDIFERVIEHLYREYKLTATNKGLQLILIKKSDNNIIYADQYTIEQVIQNLLDNAIKYTLKGKIEIILSRTKEDNLQLEITDTGIGIAKEYIPTLFDPFTQEEQGYSRSFEGNGLGLALVKNYCNLNKADISVKSKKDKGTTFTIKF